MANNLIVTGNLGVGGTFTLTGIMTVSDTTLVDNLNSDMLDGAELSTDGTLASDSDELVPTEKAVKTYVDGLDDANVKLTGAQEVAGVKTFTDGIVADVTGKADEADGVVETGTGGVTLKKKVIEIGDWNMDADATISVASGISLSKIRTVSALIRGDTGGSYEDYRLPLTGKTMGVALTDGGAVGAFDATGLISLSRIAGGIFDSANFNATSFNRGWVTIEYEA